MLVPRAGPLRALLTAQSSSRQLSRSISFLAKFSRKPDVKEPNSEESPISEGHSNTFESTEPKFDLIGGSPSLLQVKLPPSASIYTRNGAIVGVNGNFSDVSNLKFLSRKDAN